MVRLCVLALLMGATRMAWAQPAEMTLDLAVPSDYRIAGLTVLGAEFLGLLGAHEADFTLTFRHLARLQAGRADEAPLRAALADDPALEGWLARQAYASLYRMHQLSIHGAPKTGLAWLVDKLNRYLKPRMKLH